MRQKHLLGEDRWPRASWWLKLAAAVTAPGGSGLAALQGYHVAGWQGSGSDFKTVSVSPRCFVSGLGAYDFQNLTHVFHESHVALPSIRDANAPVHSPRTPDPDTSYAGLCAGACFLVRERLNV